MEITRILVISGRNLELSSSPVIMHRNAGITSKGVPSRRSAATPQYTPKARKETIDMDLSDLEIP